MYNTRIIYRKLSMSHTIYMQRCFDLARLGSGFTSPNPMVGAVIVHENRIIGEGYHRQYGGPHAEVNAVSSIKPKDQALLPYSTLYCSLEPCSIFGRTPPCCDLIIRQKIPKVVLSYIDHTPGVDGISIEKMKAAGIEVTLNVLVEKGRQLSAARNTFVRYQRPYIILKYAHSQDGFIAPAHEKAYWLTNNFSKRLVHKWRGEIDAILVGTQTALLDNPRLNNRLFYGPNPLRLVIDKKGRLPSTLHLFDGKLPTCVYTHLADPPIQQAQLEYITLDPQQSDLAQILQHLSSINKMILMVEGGANLLASFIKAGYWDEARIFESPKKLGAGTPAPSLPTGHREEHFQLQEDQLRVIYRSDS